MKIEEQKQLFRCLLQAIFLDDCSEIGDDKIIGFYHFLLESLQIRSEFEMSQDSEDYFIIESIFKILQSFHKLDSAFLLFILRDPDNIKDAFFERTNLPMEFIDDAMERLASEFQEIKYGWAFYY